VSAAQAEAPSRFAGEGVLENAGIPARCREPGAQIAPAGAVQRMVTAAPGALRRAQREGV